MIGQEALIPRGKMTLNIPEIKEEQLVFLRNQDILTISQRGVATASATGTFAGENSLTISVINIKNIRSITVAAVLKSLGTDYTVAYGEASAIISFTAAQTGDYTIPYDHGVGDSIYPDFPRDDLTINSYPRIAVDILNAPIDAFGIGGTQFISNVAFTVVIYANKSADLDTYVQAIKAAYVANPKSFYYLKFIKPTLIGPTINSPDKQDEIMQKNIDLLGMFEVDQ